MKNWHKKEISRESIAYLRERFGVDALTASIMARRGITEGKDVLYFRESDLRFLHNPFLFKAMEDAVDRILAAKDENEKILIFGDRDVDGVSATAILYSYLKQNGYDVSWRLPVGDDAYGLSLAAVEDFAKDYGSLIITVDCGISNAQEVARANELGVDVIITDHHNPPQNVPDAFAILDPKTKESCYPFDGISGAAVAFKLVDALRFAESDLYKEDFALLNVRPDKEEGLIIDCMKVRNLVKTDELSERVVPGETQITRTRLPDFLRGARIFVWDAPLVKKQLASAFGNGVEFNMADFRSIAAELFPALSGKSLLAVKDMSRLAKYEDAPSREIDGFYNLFVTFARQKTRSAKHVADEQNDLQLVALAALADIMPLASENRILVKAGLASLNEGKIRAGLSELFAHLNMSKIGDEKISSRDLSWSVIPALNAAGRLGKSNMALDLLLSESAEERDRLATEIINLNEKRKALVVEALAFSANKAEKSFSRYEKKLCVVIDEKINKGVTGLLAARIMEKYKTPAVVVTFVDDDTAAGSMRTCRGLGATEFLGEFGDFFINYGGHNAAAGFSFERKKLDEFTRKLTALAQKITLEAAAELVEIDAELPPAYMTPDILKTVDTFEPFGEGNKALVFMSKSLPVADALIIGKSERQHLKITFDCGAYKFPAVFWGEAERLGRDFNKGDKLDVLYSVARNTFNGITTPQMILADIRKSE